MEPVLLVEDKVELRAMLRKALERSHYLVEEAPDGRAAIDKVRSRRYLLVLSDLKLPGNSGIEVLREARRAEPTLPVIIMTAYGSVDEAVTAICSSCSNVRRGSKSCCAKTCCYESNMPPAMAFRGSSANIRP